MSDTTAEQNIAIKATDLVKATATIARDVSTIEAEHHQEILEVLKAISAKVDPMYEVFTNVKGWNRVTVMIMKGLAMVGGAILALYVVIEFFRKVGTK